MVIYFIFYQFIHYCLLPFFIYYLIWRKLRGKPVFGSLKERLGFIPRPQQKDYVIWLHAVSVGEVLSIEALINQIKERIPYATCYLTVGTPTGKKIAEEKLAVDHVSYLPYDLLPTMLLAYHRIKPKKIIIVEAEIWPNLLMLAKFFSIKTFLINARISQRSRKRYHRFKRFLLPLFQIFETIYTQSQYDLEEFVAFGVPEERLQVLGNIKAYNVLEKLEGQTAQKPEQKTLLVGSIHPGELDIYLNLYNKLKQTYPELRLILAPRHFHWQDELIRKVEELEFPFAVWTDKEGTTFGEDITLKHPPSQPWDILLVCKLGELFHLYQDASVYFLGGTFVPIGGHNLLEPAAWGRPTIIGPHAQNCAITARGLKKAEALYQANNEQELFKKTEELLINDSLRKTMGSNARTWLEQEAEAVEASLESLFGKLG